MPSPHDPLSQLLQEARPSPELPPRFSEQVWRRIETAEAAAQPGSWLDQMAGWLLRPKLALAGVALLLGAGILLGTHAGTQTAQHTAQLRYLASVAPDSVR